MAKAMIKCPETGKPLSILIETDRDFKERGNVLQGTYGPCPHCGLDHEFSNDDIFFEGD